jgi:hypothetical protein
MYVKNDITFIEKKVKYDGDIEFVAVDVIGKKETFIIINYYAYNKSINSYDKFKKIMGNNFKNTIIVGD